MRDVVVFLLLDLVKVVSNLFYRIDMRFLGEVPARPWNGIRLVAFLNHTSLFEPLYAGGCPPSFLFRLARHGVLPIARKTSDRAVVGRFFGLVAKHVISITRERDETWEAVLRRIDPDAMVVLFPEGRMKRANGLDSEGRPMTVRGGIAEILDSIGDGRMLIAYSGGLHHVQVPGQRWPRLWRTIRMNLEVVDLGAYQRERMAEAGREGFKRAVIADLERRRDLYCPPAT
ncbi:MAG TPA: hypothetical protein VGR07_12880 [Thermoanaerobaculia bacterium]|nr:hypothetical protein [Thermoanaerobaculia bacterium]